MKTWHSVILLWTPWSALCAILLVAGTACFSYVAWRRRGFARGVGMTEGLRLLAATLLAVTLNQPEVLHEYRPADRPTLVVLADASRSMDTRDVVRPATPLLEPLSRRETIRPLLDRQVWQATSRRLAVVCESFSSSLSPDPTRGTDLGEALDSCLKRHGNLRAIALLSDGDWNVGQPPAHAAHRLRTSQVPVFAVAVGSESRLPDLEIAHVDAPTFAVAGKAVRIPFVLESALPQDCEVRLQLASSSGQEVSKSVKVPAMGRAEDALVWLPKETGDLEMTLRVPPHPSERIHENNQRTFPLSIRNETLQVLLVESSPRWEYRYLRNALQRDPGIQVSCLLYHPGLGKVGGGSGYLKAFPGRPDELARFDVVFLGDVGPMDGQLTVEQCRLLKGLVQNQAGGLILMPGMQGRQFALAQGELSELYPVMLDETQPRGWGSRTAVPLELSEVGRRSLLTKLADSEDANARLWETLPGFQWYAPVLRAKAGSEVLATHSSEANSYGRIPLLVTRTYGTGKVLFMGTDGAWRWREGVEDRYHYRFWGQVIRWMAYQRTMAQGELMRLFYSPDRPDSGNVVTLNANVMSAAGEPLQAGTVITNIVAPSGKIHSVRLTASGAEWGLYSGAFTPLEPGQHRLELTCRENGSTLTTVLHVQDAGRETLGRPVRLDVLGEIATITRGQLVRSDDIGEVVKAISVLREPPPSIRRVRLWCHPLWAALLVALLGLFWTARKLIGVV